MFNRIIYSCRNFSGNVQKHVKFQECHWSSVARCYSNEVLQQTSTRRILSGIQPTGNIHLGNYIGAIQRWVNLQNEEKNTFWFIADMHAITLPQKPEILWENILKMCAILLACGIDPNRSILFQQSKVCLHGQLCWILSTLLTTNRLTHLHHYKEKAKTEDIMLHGLLSYPILQAADILLYKTTHVPVGQDQIQHVQLVQHLAEKFNNTFDKTFPVPDALIGMNGNRIKSLRDPTKKMSKSNVDSRGRIELTDTPDEILRKVKKAVTDFTSEVTYDETKRPGVSNLITIHSMMTGKSVKDICKEAENLNTGKYKLLLAEVLIEKLSPIRIRYSQLLQEPGYLMEVLKQGSEKAKTEASKCMQEVYIKTGLMTLNEENKNMYNQKRFKELL